MPTRPTDPIFAWALDVLGVRPPPLTGTALDVERAWASWKERAVAPAGRFTPGRSDHDVRLATDVILASEPPRSLSTSPTLPREAEAHLQMQFDRFGFA